MVFMLRDVERLSTAEAAICLDLSQENVKVRLHRAYAALRKQLYGAIGDGASRCFEFHAVRCDRVVGNLFGLLRMQPPVAHTTKPTAAIAVGLDFLQAIASRKSEPPKRSP